MFICISKVLAKSLLAPEYRPQRLLELPEHITCQSQKEMVSLQAQAGPEADDQDNVLNQWKQANNQEHDDIQTQPDLPTSPQSPQNQVEWSGHASLQGK